MKPMQGLITLSRTSTIAIAFGLVIFIGIIDYATGYEVSFFIFYLIPIALSSWLAGKKWGFYLSLASIVVWRLADVMAGHPSSHFFIPSWNAAVRFGFFLGAVFALDRLQQAHQALTQQNEELQREITTRQQAEAEVRRLNHELAQRVAEIEATINELTALSYSISHNLRAPVRALAGFSSILVEEHAGQLSDEAQHQLRRVRANAQLMGRLIDDLLVFTSLGRQPLAKQVVAPADLARQALDDLRTEQEGRHVEVIIDDLPLCHADPTLLKQVFVHLLANALKFTRRREVAVIAIGWREDAGAPGIPVCFVKDNGVGFDMQYAGQLFGLFHRLHHAEEYEGTGIGLAIVQRIVQRHGGRVWAEAAIDQGTTISFTLAGRNSPA